MPHTLTCPTHYEFDGIIVSLVFLPSVPLNMAKVYKEVILILSNCRLVDCAIQMSAFEVITCVITAIWRTKWLNYFEAVGFDKQSVVVHAMINLRHLSPLN